MNAERVIKKLIEQSDRFPENLLLIKKYVANSLKRGDIISFYNWECPPRTLSFGAKGRMVVDYDVDYNKVFQGQKNDQFTELPRIVSQYERENRQLKLFKLLGLKFRFVKIVADTNAIYLTRGVNSKDLAIVKKKFFTFKKMLEGRAKENYDLLPEIYFFSNLMRPLKKIYDENYSEILEMDRKSLVSLLSRTIWQKELMRLKEHVGFGKKNQKELEKFAKRVIASYAAEGMIFDRLTSGGKMKNCVWLNNEEVEDSAIAITNCLRKKNNLGNLPMLFLK